MAMDGIYGWAQSAPDKVALRVDGVRISYLRFARGIETMRHALAAHELPAGSTAIVAIHGLLDCWTAVLALRALGVQTVVVSTLDEAPALGLEPVSCVVTDPHQGDQSSFMAGHWPRARLIRVSTPVHAALPAGPAPELLAATVSMGGHILYTSGTTGTYKKLLMPAESEPERNQARALSNAMTETDVWYLGYLGLWTAVGYNIPCAVWQTGGCVVFDQRPQWAEHFFQQGVTHAMLVPQMIGELLKAGDRKPVRRGDWQLIATAGFLSAETARRVLAQLTPRLSILYGATELCSRALEASVTVVEDMHWLVPYGNRLVEIVNDQGGICAEGEEGQLRVRLTPLDSQAYLGSAEASRKVFRMGYFYPGDMAVRRADGRIRVLGRNADVLNLQGRKIAVAPVEQAIQDWLGVGAVCLFSGINAEGQEEVVVALEAVREPSAEQLDALRQQLTEFDRVRVAVCAEFPRTTTGTSKINRKALRRQLFAQQPRASELGDSHETDRGYPDLGAAGACAASGGLQ